VTGPSIITTERLRLIPTTEGHLRAALSGNAVLAAAIGRVVPASWPPEHFDAAAIQFTLDWLRRHPADAKWGFYCIELPGEAGIAGTLVGAGGFKGAPDPDGIVEIGYSVLPEFQRRGFACEAVMGWVTFAFAQPRVRVICAHTLASAAGSIGVLKKSGFKPISRGQDPGAPPDQEVIRFERVK
jgi:ribosomal-protein-alanine N-acetyltransferase